MAIGKFVFGKDRKKSHSFDRAENLSKVHGDLKDLLWFADGSHRNSISTSESDCVSVGTLRMTVDIDHSADPSVIYSSLPVGKLPETSSEMKTAGMPAKWTSYQAMTPKQRAVYWILLEDPYRLFFPMGYLSTLYAGLERHMMAGEYEKAIKAVINLRYVQSDQQFQNASANAIMMTCLQRRRPDLMLLFQESMDTDHSYSFSEELYILTMYGLGMGFTAVDAMRLAGTFGIGDTSSIDYYFPIFERFMTENIRKEFGTDSIPLDEFFENQDLTAMEQETTEIYIGPESRIGKYKIPRMSRCETFRKKVFELLKKSEQDVKDDMKRLEDAGILLNAEQQMKLQRRKS